MSFSVLSSVAATSNSRFDTAGSVTTSASPWIIRKGVVTSGSFGSIHSGPCIASAYALRTAQKNDQPDV